MLAFLLALVVVIPLLLWAAVDASLLPSCGELRCLGLREFLSSIGNIVVAVATVFLGIFTWRQIGIAREAAGIARRSAEYISGAERAHLWMEKINLISLERNPDQARKIQAICQVRNSGRTPGFIHRIVIHYQIGEADLPHEPEIQGPAIELAGSFIAPNYFTKYSGFQTTSEIQADLIAGIMNGQKKIFYWGIIYFSDVFGDEYESGFAYRVKWHAVLDHQETLTVGSRAYWRYRRC
jgi:hypothetical protein